MQDPQLYTGIFLAIGLLIGSLAAWLITYYSLKARFVDQETLHRSYVQRDVFDHLQQQSDLLRDDMAEKEEEIRDLLRDLSRKDQTILHLDDAVKNREKEFQALRQRSELQFEQVANRLLEEKSQKFTAHNQEQLQNLLAPLRQQIKTFEEGIEKRFFQETRDRISLQKEIENLRGLNQQLSQDANNLASALKGDSKTQGDWGEYRLEQLLQRAGLQAGIHYHSQNSYRDQNGQQKRPDFIIDLPGRKHLIIDAKVSLKAYEQYHAAEGHQKQEQYLREHLQSIRRHIRDLSQKQYEQLYQIESPDYLLLFIPIEPAFALAMQQDPQLFSEALDRNVVLVSTSTLLATMRTVSFIWNQEKQKRNVVEIARQSGLLYDKFCGFIDDMQTVGSRLESAMGAHQDAMRKLVESRKKGDTLIGRAERIRELGAKASKVLPQDLIDQSKLHGNDG